MAQQVAAGDPVSSLRPFSYRIGLPWLVGTLFPSDIMFGFRLINLTFAIATLAVLYLFLRGFRLRRDTCLLLLLLFVCAPQSPLRFVHYIPAYTDPPALFFVVFLLYLTQAVEHLDLRWSIVVTTITVIGVLFREIAICGAMVFAFEKCFRVRSSAPFLMLRSKRNFSLCLPPLALAAVTLALLHSRIEGTGEYHYLQQMVGVVSGLARQPDILALSWLTAFGVIPLVLLLAARRTLSAFLAENQAVAVFLLGSAVLALIAGFHTDRIVFWSFPAVLLLFGVFLERHPHTTAPLAHKLALFLPLALAQMLAFRIWLPIPDDPHGELFNPGAPPLLLLSAYGDVTLGHTYASTLPEGSRLVLLGQYLAVLVYFGIVLRWMGGRKSPSA